MTPTQTQYAAFTPPQQVPAQETPAQQTPAQQTLAPYASLPPRQGASRDIAHTTGIPFRRLLLVEARKLVDTRSGTALLSAIGVLTVAVILLSFLTMTVNDLTMHSMVGATSTPLSLLLPVLGILTVTTEWTQRTALVTFTLVPRRTDVLLAKVVVAFIVGLASSVIAVGCAGGLTMLARHGASGSMDMTPTLIAGFVGLTALLVIQGVAFGMLFLNTPAAIVCYFAVPFVYSILGFSVAAFKPIAEWTDINRTSAVLFSDQTATATQWAQLGVSVGVWVLLPLVFGMVRTSRKEIS